MALATVLGLKRLGFFIPYRYAANLPGPGERPGYPAIGERLRAAEPRFRELLALIDGQAAALAALGQEPPPAPRWTQDWFPRLDAATAYALIRDRAPRRIVEIGSGHSTRFLARAVTDGGLATRITCIDPAPRRSLNGLAVDAVAKTLHEAGEGPFRDLAAGDVLFVDSSHILMPGSDVDWVLNQLLPALAPGVLIHFHDIFLPDDYPDDWAWRGYNEQQGVAPLLGGGGYEIVFASHYVATRMASQVAATVLARLPLPAGAFESSLWLRKREAGGHELVSAGERR